MSPAAGDSSKPDKGSLCLLCKEHVNGDLGAHVRNVHSRVGLEKAVLMAKEQGVSDARIRSDYHVSFREIDEIVIGSYGINLSNIQILKEPRRITRWEPRRFREQTTTVWRFPDFGIWATHNGAYRGNPEPYIPRNIILKYSRPGDVVLDCFVGGGTTVIETKLLGRRGIGIDVNPKAVELTLQKLKFSLPERFAAKAGLTIYEPQVSVGDARELDLQNDSVDLICTDPPYGNLVAYSLDIQGDFSRLPDKSFGGAMLKVGQEALRVLKPGGKCAVLMGYDWGFETVRLFLEAGFMISDFVVVPLPVHKGRSNKFWSSQSTRSRFPMRAHKYLLVFEKPPGQSGAQEAPVSNLPLSYASFADKPADRADPASRPTTFWQIPYSSLKAEIPRRIADCFDFLHGQFVHVVVGAPQSGPRLANIEDASTIYVKLADKPQDKTTVANCRSMLMTAAKETAEILLPAGILAIDVSDIAIDGVLHPLGFMVWQDMRNQKCLVLKNVIVVVPEGKAPAQVAGSNGRLSIAHRYVLVYARTSAGSPSPSAQRVAYSQSPIEQVVCEFRFDQQSSYDLTIPGLMYGRLEKYFPLKRQLLEVDSELIKELPSGQERRGTASFMEFRAQHQASFVRIGERYLSVHWARPYASWQEFRFYVGLVLEAYVEVVKPSSLAGGALRYFNRIELPKEGFHIADYFQFRLVPGTSLPPHCLRFKTSAEFIWHGGRDVLQIELRNESSASPQKLSFALDLHYCINQPDKLKPEPAEVYEWLDTGHFAIHEAFESAIQDKLRHIIGVIKEHE